MISFIPDPNRRLPLADPSHTRWLLDPGVVFLNHGSFGSCPRVVFEFQTELRLEMERRPVEFLARKLEGRLDQAREALAGFVGAAADDLVFVQNATSGINSVLRSIPFDPGDELLVTNQEYNACRNALNYAAESRGARVVVVELPFPLESSETIKEAIRRHVTRRTRLVLIDHVTSQTGLVLPLESIVAELTELGIDTLVDGAHAPGMLRLNLRALKAAYYTGNCHKWICAPKGAAFLHVREDRQHLVRPLTISHGANSARKDRSRLQLEFGWMGTSDPTPALCVPKALEYIESLVPGGWDQWMAQNRALALQARSVICAHLGIPLPCPDSMIGALASIPLPDGTISDAPVSPLYSDPLQDELREQFAIEVPVIPWPSPPQRLLRISAQSYNAIGQYEYLAQAVRSLIQPTL